MSIYGNILKNQDINYYYLNEAYIGKTDILIEAEKQLSIIRQAIKNQKFKDLEKFPEVLKFNRLMEKQFGMDCFVLKIDQLDDMNAFTIVVNSNLDIALKYDASKLVTGSLDRGYRFIDDNKLCVVVNINKGLFRDEMTDGEILACILHEIGHNFSNCIHNKLKLANEQWAKSYRDGLIAITLLTWGIGGIYALREYSKNTNRKKRRKGKRKHKNIFRGFFKYIKDSIKNKINNNSEFSDRTSDSSYINDYKNYIDKQDPEYKNKIRTSIDRQDEVMADKFAAIYGYGPESASLNIKLSTLPSVAEAIIKKSKNPYDNKYNDQYNYNYRDIYDYDCHPHFIQRVNEEIKTLKAELTREGHDPKYEVIIKEQIKQMEDMLKEVIELRKDMSKSEEAQVNYYKLVYEDQPDAVTEEIENFINDLYDERLTY